jgi:AraC-like DNA-binding protein
MPSFLTQVQKGLREENALRLSASDFAKRFFCSETTLRRKLRKHGTSFTAERNTVRVQVAFELLLRGYSVEQAGRRIGLTPDHFRVVFKRAYGFPPERIKLAATVAERLRGEPMSRTEPRQAERDDRLLQKLLVDIDASHPLNEWAKRLILVGHHPERQTAGYEEALREKERAAYRRQQDIEDAIAVAAIPIDDLDRIDVTLLLDQKEHRHEQMRWRANQRRRKARGTA